MLTIQTVLLNQCLRFFFFVVVLFVLFFFLCFFLFVCFFLLLFFLVVGANGPDSNYFLFVLEVVVFELCYVTLFAKICLC